MIGNIYNLWNQLKWSEFDRETFEVIFSFVCILEQRYIVDLSLAG